MKTLITCLILSWFTFACYAQVNLSPKDFDNLVALGDLYSHNTMAKGEDFAKSAKALHTPALDKIITKLIAIGKADTTLLNSANLARPGNDELVLWYVLREIHYNRVDTTRKPLPAIDVAKEVLGKEINEKWLLDNYYYFMRGGLAMLFNEADLSQRNIDINSLGFKDQTERAILFLNLMDGFIVGRYLVLSYLKKYDKVLEFSKKLPKINGEYYFNFTDLDVPDFTWIGYLKQESYNERHIGAYLNALFIQYAANIQTGKTLDAREIYYNSLMYKPAFFKYSKNGDLLRQIYDKNKK